jgi:hypothetical protein
MNTSQAQLGKEIRSLKRDNEGRTKKSRLTADPNRPDCTTCSAPMTRYGLYKGSPIYQCISCKTYRRIRAADCVAPPVQRLRPARGQYDLVFCLICSTHPKMTLAGYRTGRRMWVCVKRLGGCGSTVLCGCIHHQNGENLNEHKELRPRARRNFTPPAPEAEWVFCINKECRRRMVHTIATSSTGKHEAYYCRPCGVTARKYQAPQHNVWQHRPALLNTSKPLTIPHKELLGASCRKCGQEMILTKKTMRRSRVTDAWRCSRKCNLLIVAVRKPTLPIRDLNLRSSDLYGANCLGCEGKMILRLQRRKTKNTPSFTLIWCCEKCSKYASVQYINHVRTPEFTTNTGPTNAPPVKKTRKRRKHFSLDELRRPAAEIPGIDAELFSQACVRVEQIVSKKLPALFRQDICQNMLVDVWEHRIMVDELTVELAGLYRLEQNRFFGHAKKMRSLETPVGENKTCTLGDSIPG